MEIKSTRGESGETRHIILIRFDSNDSMKMVGVMDLSCWIEEIAKGAGFFARDENSGLEKGDSRN